MRAEIERAARVVRAALDFDWTWSLSDMTDFCDRVGWRANIGEGHPEVITDFDLNRPDAHVTMAYDTEASAPRRFNQFVFNVTDVVLDRPDLKPQLDQAFDTLAQRVFEEVGERPTRWWVEPRRGLHWDLPTVVITITASAEVVSVYVVSPEYQRWNDEFDARLENDN